MRTAVQTPGLLSRKSSGPLGVKTVVRYLLIVAAGAILIWLGSLLWQMLQSTGHTF
jgi:hypothetical protein